MMKKTGWRVCSWVQRIDTYHSKGSWAFGSELSTRTCTDHDLVFPSREASSSLLRKSYSSWQLFFIVRVSRYLLLSLSSTLSIKYPLIRSSKGKFNEEKHHRENNFSRKSILPFTTVISALHITLEVMLKAFHVGSHSNVYVADKKKYTNTRKFITDVKYLSTDVKSNKYWFITDVKKFHIG